MFRLSQQAGVTIVEVVIGISIVATAVVAVAFSVTSYVDAREALLMDTKAAYLADEGYEIIRALRDTDWTTFAALTTGSTHYLNVSTTTIAFTTTPETIDTDYQRSFVIEDVYRNASDDIVESTTPGATVDTESRAITVSVTSPNSTISFEAILTNLDAS